MVGGGAEAAGAARSRTARGRPNWWVVLAVSLALIAVLVATAGTTPRPLRARALGGHTATDARSHTSSDTTAGRARSGATGAHGSVTTTTTSTTAPAAAPGATASGGAPLLSTAFAGAAHAAPSGGTSAPTTTVPAVTTTTAPAQSTTQQPASRGTQSEGYLDPPLQTSQAFVFTGSGATEVSVIWSGSTYLTMVVSCPNDNQSVGGTSAMQATLPDAAGSCRATVSEPSSESTTLTFTITIGPPGG